MKIKIGASDDLRMSPLYLQRTGSHVTPAFFNTFPLMDNPNTGFILLSKVYFSCMDVTKTYGHSNVVSEQEKSALRKTVITS